MNDQEKFEYLATLFKQRQEVEDKIKAVINGERGIKVNNEDVAIKKIIKRKYHKSAAGEKVCSECGKPPKRYLCKGLCEKCYNIANYKKKQVAKEDDLKHYECIDCGELIDSPLPFDEVKCPNNSNHSLIQK